MPRYGVFDVLTIGGLWLWGALAVAALLFGVPIPAAVFIVLALGIAVVAKVAGDGWARFNDERSAQRHGGRDTGRTMARADPEVERTRLSAVDRAAVAWARGERGGGQR